LRYSIERSSVLKKLEETQRLSRIGNWEFVPATNAFSASNEVFKIFGQNVQKSSSLIHDLKSAEPAFGIFDEIHSETLAEKTVKKDIKIHLTNGETRYVYIQSRINTNAESELVINGIIQDITERKLAEQELVKSQERYQDVFNKSKDAIYICNQDGKLVDFNKATSVLFGLDREALEKIEDIHQLYEPADSRDAFLQLISSKEAVKDFELEVMGKEGEKRYCLITATI